MAAQDETSTMRRAIALLALYVVAGICGGLLFAALMRLWASFGPGVMFYRGVVALAATGVALVVVMAFALPRLPRRFGLGAADALGGSIVCVCILLAIFVLGPVTVDRSVSVFMLSQIESAETPLAADDIRARFVSRYLTEWDQVGRRLSEQQLSGNIERSDGGWILTPQGQRFMNASRAMSAWFGGDPRFVGRN